MSAVIVGRGGVGGGSYTRSASMVFNDYNYFLWSEERSDYRLLMAQNSQINTAGGLGVPC